MLTDFILKQNKKLPQVERPEVQTRTQKLAGGRRLSDALINQNSASMKSRMSGSATEVNRVQGVSDKLNKLIINRIYADKDISVTVYDGKATELVQDYEKYKNLEASRDAEIERIKNEISQKKSSIPAMIKDMSRREREQADKAVYETKTALEEIKNNMQESILLKKEKLEQEIKNTVSSYQEAYKAVLNDAVNCCKEVQEIIKELHIQNKAQTIPNFNGEEPDVDELLELVKQDRELILQLRSVNVDVKVLSKMVSDRDKHINSSLMIATSATFSPVALGSVAFKIGKKILDIGVNKKLIIQLHDEILLCYKIIRTQIQDLKDSYQEPSTKRLEEELAEVETNAEYEFKGALERAQSVYNNAIRERNIIEENLAEKLRKEQLRLEQEVADLEEEGAITVETMNESIEEYKASWLEQRQEFLDSQVLPDLTIDRVTEITEELTPGSFLNEKRETTIDRFRLFAKSSVLHSLTLNTTPTDDSDEAKERAKYDAQVLVERDKVDKRIRELEDLGYTKESLGEQLEQFRRELDHYFIPRYRGLISGVHLLPPNVKEAIGGADEYFKCDFDNHTLVFAYDDEHDGEENVLGNYIKYIVQQLMINYHPSSLKVNIINPTISRLFSNLQIDLSKKDKNTGEIIPGRPYSDFYTSQKDIDECYHAIDDNLHRLEREMIKQDYDGLVMERRKNGAVTPVYQVNILHRVDLNTPFAKFNEEAGNIGVMNIYLVSKDKFLQMKKDGGNLVEEPTSDVPFLKNVAIFGETKKEGEDNIIYLTNLKQNKVTRFVYKLRTKEEENKLSDLITKRAKQLPTSPVLTEEFVDNVTGGKYWQGTAKKFVKLYFGYINGDQSKPTPTVLDENDSVHMFIGGTTGGGKSNLLAVMVNTLKMMYPPSQLDIIYFDFKVVEVALHARPYKMPHCTAMSGTAQASYLISLLNFCIKEMENRYQLVKKYGVAKLSEIIDAMTAEVEELKAKGEIEKAKEIEKQIPRRMLLIVDEAAQAFQLEDQNAVEVVKLTFKKISQLARAAGMHMILVSQDPSKMPGEVMNLLRVRGCTKATPDVSKSIMNGNDICGRSENQFIGFFATNNDPKGAESANKSYVVPLNMPDVTKRFSKIAYDMSKDDLNRDAVIFDDNEDYSIKKHKLFLAKNPGILTGRNLLLGEPVVFQKEFKPAEIVFQSEEQENLGIFSANNDVKANMFKSIVDSLWDNSIFWPVYCKTIPRYAPLDLFVNKAKEQGYYGEFVFFMGKNIVDYEEYDAIYEDTCEQFWKGDMRPKTDPRYADTWSVHFMDYLPRLINKRKQQKDCKPMYIFMFDMDKHNAVISLELNWKDFASTVNTLNMYDIHIIYISSMGSLPLSKNFIKHVLATQLGDDSAYGKPFKRIPTEYVKYIDMIDDSKSLLIKPISY